MALKDILAAMEAEAGVEIKRLMVEADASATRIKAEAEQEAQAIRERLRQELHAPLDRERARRLNHARRDARNAVGHAQEALLAEALDMARAELAACSHDPAYPDLLRALIAEALDGIDGSAVLYADPRDLPVLQAIMPGVPVVRDLQTWGGVEARSADGRVVVTNTLEARLHQAQPMIRQRVMPLFVGEEDAWATSVMPMHGSVR